MTRMTGGGGTADFDWQAGALEEQAAAANIPGHVNINFNNNTNINIDFTPTADGDYSAFVDALKEVFSSM